jgi:hypothetical protein
MRSRIQQLEKTIQDDGPSPLITIIRDTLNGVMPPKDVIETCLTYPPGSAGRHIAEAIRAGGPLGREAL